MRNITTVACKVEQETKQKFTLFWAALSGAMAVEFILGEMGVPYRLAAVDMAAGEHRSRDYPDVNPAGQVPALALPDGKVIGESAAIILTLGDRHPETSLVPRQNQCERPNFLRWLIYMVTSPYMTFVQFNHPERFLPIRQPMKPSSAMRAIVGFIISVLLTMRSRGNPFPAFGTHGAGLLCLHAGGVPSRTG